MGEDPTAQVATKLTHHEPRELNPGVLGAVQKWTEVSAYHGVKDRGLGAATLIGDCSRRAEHPPPQRERRAAADSLRFSWVRARKSEFVRAQSNSDKT